MAWNNFAEVAARATGGGNVRRRTRGKNVRRVAGNYLTSDFGFKQLASIDAMLKAMFDWEPEADCYPKGTTTSTTLPKNSPQDAAGLFQPEDSASGAGEDGGSFIAYTTEALEWVKGCSGKVKVKDFGEWLKGKYPPHLINRNSINQPFRKLVKDGILILVRQGAGKMPSIFEVNPNPPQRDDE